MTWLVDDLLVGIKSVSPLKCFDTVGRLIGMAFCLVETCGYFPKMLYSPTSKGRIPRVGNQITWVYMEM